MDRLQDDLKAAVESCEVWLGQDGVEGVRVQRPIQGSRECTWTPQEEKQLLQGGIAEQTALVDGSQDAQLVMFCLAKPVVGDGTLHAERVFEQWTRILI